MEKTAIHHNYLQVVYLIIMIILFSLIIYTPTFIEGPVHITKKLFLEEETFEGILIGILFIVSVIILNLYKRELDRHKEQLNRIKIDKKNIEDRLLLSDQYIGMVNVQIQDIASIFNSIENYPKTKTDLIRNFTFFGKRILGITNSGWTIIRIIERKTQRTLFEHIESKEKRGFVYPTLSNKMLIENKQVLSNCKIISNIKSPDILVFCILSVDKIGNNELIFIQAIINEITKLIVIINSTYNKQLNKMFMIDEPTKTKE